MMDIRKLLAALLLLGLLFSPGLAARTTLASPAAQGVVRINYGQSIEGTITNENYFLIYEFGGRAGDVVTIEMFAVSGDLDPFVGLFDPGDQLLVSNDDIDRASGNYNARIEGYTLPVDGTYSIGATRFNVADGTSTGTFRLTLLLVTPGVGGTPTPTGVVQPTPVGNGTLGTPPDLGVPAEQIQYNQVVSGQITEAESSRYYVFAGDEGDLLTASLTPTGGDLVPFVRLYNATLVEVSRGISQDDGRDVAFLAVPVTGWYLVEVTSQGGGGTFELQLQGFPAQPLVYGDTVSGEVTANESSQWYVFHARHGDTVNLQMMAGGGNLIPYAVLGDVNLNDLSNTIPGQNPATLVYTIPRTGTYVILASRQGLSDGTTTGPFTLTLSGTPVNPAALNVTPLGYGSETSGSVGDTSPVAYYSFQGKAGDLVTISMEATGTGSLDPYLILADANFNELTFSNDTGTSTNARIFQYTLPEAGEYYILATRPDLALGRGGGDFTLALTGGEVELTAGTVEATLRWSHTADMDLFVADPNGDTVAWDNPQVPSGGILELDTNGNCQTLTPLPVEHIYWPQGTHLPGTYTIAVIYQLDCENHGPVTFDLSVSVGGQEVARVTQQLERGQRYRMSITVNADGTAVNNNDGVIDIPQQESGSTESTIAYGDTVTGTINSDQVLLIYRFNGQAGDSIVITVEQISGDLDPVVGLFDANDNRLAFDDDSGGERNSRLLFTLPVAGQYTIAVSRYQVETGTTSGDFRLTLIRTN